ncbi:cell division protein FtsX [Flavisphingomonas formosensis]|uniref:cell division protein FtsX n=1 Tax=Flavisphingomonas formosensis TaxID=861534 RepID=UPI001E60160B|nr:FtsX-like permease family protein [Sphingomonas formosensis]
MAGPMPWVIAIMMFLTVLAAAAGMSLAVGAHTLGNQLGGRITVQIVEASPDAREAQVAAVITELNRTQGVGAVSRMSEADMARLLAPWFGAEGLGPDIPVPALIDAELSPAAHARIDRIAAAVAHVAPAAKIDDHAAWLAPLAGLVRSLEWLALALVLLMALATGCAVVLASRAALNTHRQVIDVMHLMGATDIQIARLFQRRIALDALFSGLVGLAVAVLVILLLGERVEGLGSELLGSMSLPVYAWGILTMLPIAGALLATVAARLTVVGALRRML